MTYREFLNTCDDEFTAAVVILNLARSHPNYENLTRVGKHKVVKEILDQEMPGTKGDDVNE